MINLLIPSMGKSLFFEESFFPKPIVDVAGEPMMERAVKNFDSLPDKRFIFVFGRNDCSEFHLDDSARLLAGKGTEVLVLENETAGAICTCLMAVEKLNLQSPLFIANCDQVIDVNYQEVVNYFSKNEAEAGVITFDSIHPRWSYAKIKEGIVVETAEKRPLSKNAIAGCYYYAKAIDFITAAESVVLKGNSYKGKYYISSTINELVLMGKKVSSYNICSKHYHSFYSHGKIKEYERYLQENCQ